MTARGVTESVVEEAALAWLEGVGWRVAHGPDIVPDMSAAERDDDGEVVLARRLRAALARVNPALLAEVLEDEARTGVLTAGREWFKPWRARV